MAKPRLEPAPEFHRFGLGFHRDFDMRGKTEDEVWAIVLDPFTGQDRIRLREFLDRITRDDISDAELLRCGMRGRPTTGSAGAACASCPGRPASGCFSRRTGRAEEFMRDAMTPPPIAPTMHHAP